MVHLKLYSKEHSLTHSDRQMVEALKAVSFVSDETAEQGEYCWTHMTLQFTQHLSPSHFYSAFLSTAALQSDTWCPWSPLSLSSPPFTDPLVLMEEIFVSYPTQKHLSIVTTNSKLEHSEFRKYLCKTLGNCLHGKQGRRHCKHWFCKTELHLNYLYFSATRRQDKTDWAFFESKTCSTERWWLRNGLSWSIIWAHLV